MAWGLIASWTIGVALLAPVAMPGLMDMVQPVDDEVREWAVSAERDVPVAVAKVLAVVGRLWFIAPLVGVVAIVLGLRRRRCELATLLVAFALALLLHGSIKVLVERERPADPLVETGQWSFPSGHSVNAAVIAITLVMVLVPPERRRPILLAGALLDAVVMAWSRVYLRAHWLTDVVAGVAFGAAAALTAVAIVNVGSRALAAVVAAFGASVPFTALIFVSVGTGLLAGLAPVPGGIGVAEATMTALLTGVGLRAEQAFSIAVTYRLVTSYLPPVLGFFSLNWMTEKGYI